MSRKLGPKMKKCVTCQYWTGPRSITKLRNFVEWQNDKDTGICAGGGWNRQQRTAVHSCNKWVKWSAFK
jgi:hypothetical protein